MKIEGVEVDPRQICPLKIHPPEREAELLHLRNLFGAEQVYQSLAMLGVNHEVKMTQQANSKPAKTCPPLKKYGPEVNHPGRS
ncbi:MAG: hypothetical protein P8R54_24980 [Myxococcota bacterium]|nr:hypothetical protein [Myxococcota bacterium]